MNWRFFFDYSGGNVYENMCHQLSFWYKALKLQVPRAVTMNGGIYLWKDGREVPDTMSVSMEQPEEMLITWASGFGNNQLGITEHVLGDNGTIQRANQLHYLPQKMNSPTGMEMMGNAKAVPHEHMLNFFDCVRTGKETNCPFRPRLSSGDCKVPHGRLRQLIAFGRTVRWDAQEVKISRKRWTSASHRSNSSYVNPFASFARRRSSPM